MLKAVEIWDKIVTPGELNVAEIYDSYLLCSIFAKLPSQWF